MKKIISTPQAPAAIGPYSQGTQMSGDAKTTWLSGQIPLDPATGQIVSPGDVAAQTRRVLQNISALLTEIGASPENVVKTTIFLKSMDHFTSVNEVYASFFTKNPPARSTVEVARLPKDALVEIECIVVQ
ncbi:MAG: RidA family protein [Bdellovibrionales bacterium]|nr:RidA family protein [Bdellovibrionales bacterium]